jgi:hypothetical protein
MVIDKLKAGNERRHERKMRKRLVCFSSYRRSSAVPIPSLGYASVAQGIGQVKSNSCKQNTKSCVTCVTASRIHKKDAPDFLSAKCGSPFQRCTYMFLFALSLSPFPCSSFIREMRHDASLASYPIGAKGYKGKRENARRNLFTKITNQPDARVLSWCLRASGLRLSGLRLSGLRLSGLRPFAVRSLLAPFYSSFIIPCWSLSLLTLHSSHFVLLTCVTTGRSPLCCTSLAVGACDIKVGFA